MVDDMVVTAVLEGGKWVTRDLGAILDDEDYSTVNQIKSLTGDPVVSPVQHDGKDLSAPVYVWRTEHGELGFVALADIQAAMPVK